MTVSPRPRRRGALIGAGVLAGTALLVILALVVRSLVLLPLNHTVTTSLTRLAEAIEESSRQPTSPKDWPADLRAQADTTDGDDSGEDDEDEDEDEEAEHCEGLSLDCVTLTVPADHGNPEGSETIPVTFGIQPAYGERLGALVIAVGGPGTPGVESAEYYAPAFGAFAESYDLVFFDQRAVRSEDPVGCDEATDEFAGVWNVPDLATADEEAITQARQFAEACAADAGITTENSHHYASWQSAGDIEAFRTHIGDEQLFIYAESYGTLPAQAYAEAYPDRVAGLILDGPMDPREGLDGLALGRTEALNEVFALIFATCAEDPACAADFPDGDPAAAYDAVLAQSAAGELTFDFPTWQDRMTSEVVQLTELRSVANGYIYAERQRTQLLRAVADAAAEDYVLLGRLTGASPGEPDLAITFPDLASYFATTCADLPAPASDAEQAAREFVARGEAAGVPSWRSGALYYFFLACHFWPQPSAPWPDPPSADERPYPTLILTATADPATPHEDARRLFETWDNTSLVTVEGGGHVLVVSGNSCGIDVASDFLRAGGSADGSEHRCDGEVYDDYQAVMRPALADYATPLEAMSAVGTHITMLPELDYLEWISVLEIGCDLGGTLEVADEGDHLDFEFDDCALLEGLTFTDGSAALDTHTWELSLDVELPNGELHYDQTFVGDRLTGTLDGEEIGE